MKILVSIFSLLIITTSFATNYTCESSFVIPSGEDWTTVGYGRTQSEAAINAVDQCLRHGFDHKTCTPYSVDCWKDSPLPFSAQELWECKSLSIDNFSAVSYSQDKMLAKQNALESCYTSAEVPDSCFANCKQVVTER